MIKQYHVIPFNDTFDHKQSEECKCGFQKVTVENGNQVIIHHSFDCRELKEALNEQLN